MKDPVLAAMASFWGLIILGFGLAAYVGRVTPEHRENLIECANDFVYMHYPKHNRIVSCSFAEHGSDGLLPCMATLDKAGEPSKSIELVCSVGTISHTYGCREGDWSDVLRMRLERARAASERAAEAHRQRMFQESLRSN